MMQKQTTRLEYLTPEQLIAAITVEHLVFGKNKDLARLFKVTQAQISNWSRNANASYMERSLRYANSLGLPKTLAVAGLDARRAHMQRIQKRQAELTQILDLLLQGAEPYAS
jgi:peptidoglycan/xylan/chitin deacetylase (PgdA/CDA1 family)